MKLYPVFLRPSRWQKRSWYSRTRRLSARRIQFITGRDITVSCPMILTPALSDPSAITIVFMGNKHLLKKKTTRGEWLG